MDHDDLRVRRLKKIALKYLDEWDFYRRQAIYDDSPELDTDLREQYREYTKVRREIEEA